LQRLYTFAYVYVMAATEVLTLRLDSRVSRRLDKLSKATDRTKSRLAADAIEKYVEDQSWQIEAIHAGLRQAEAGELIPHEEVVAWARGLSKPTPRSRRRK
jgi:RHH-type rel operon transcriptional repressor/antitoxin RelB